jgi:TP901 family phage tail tape measure protein
MPSSFDATLNVKLNSANLNASSKKIEMALGRITGQASEFQKSLDASTARVFAFGATTAVLNGVNQAFKKLISTTIDVQKRLVEINSIFQATEKTFNRFRNSIFTVAKETGQAFATVADGAAELARQGLSAEETAKRLKAALVLTRISGLGAEKSVKALTAAINGFSSAGLNANQIVNKMVAVDTAFAVSAQDLAEAFSRAGSTAEDAGVSFDQLLGLVTAVEQKTARGGAVIGNAFKSIFTRLSRGNTIESLQDLGVAIDNTQTGIQKLQALSSAIRKIADPSVVSEIKELAGGVFQINVVSAALKDLSSETSIFAGAAKTAAAASNEAFQKNAELNKTLASQINALVQGLTSMGERIGELTFGPLLQSLVGLASKFTGFLDKALDPEKGNAFIKGFFKAIGSFLSGPAVVIFTSAFIKIFALVAKFAKDGLKAVFAIGSESSKIKNVEAGIVGLLQKDKTLRGIILSSTTSQVQKEAAVINAIRAENALLTQQSALMNSIASAARARGVGGFSGATGRFSSRKGMAFAGGFQEEEAMARGLGAGNSVKAHFGQGTIGGRNFIMNNQEMEVPRFGGGADSAVIPMYPAGNPRVLGGSAAGAAAAQKRKVTRVLVDPSSYAFITPSKAAAMEASNFTAGHKGSTKVGGKPVSFQLSNKIQSYSPNLTDTDQISEPYDSKLYKKMSTAATNAAVSYGGMIAVPSGNKANRNEIKGLLGKKGSKGAYGAIRGAAGAAFEAAVTSAFGVQDFSKGKKFGDFDIRKLNTQGKGELAETLGTGDKRTGDLKVGVSRDTVASFIGKIIKERGGPSKFRSIKTNRARGFIPKLAKGSKIPKFAKGFKAGKGKEPRPEMMFLALSSASMALNTMAMSSEDTSSAFHKITSAASGLVTALMTLQTLSYVTGGKSTAAVLGAGQFLGLQRTKLKGGAGRRTSGGAFSNVGKGMLGLGKPQYQGPMPMSKHGIVHKANRSNPLPRGVNEILQSKKGFKSPKVPKSVLGMTGLGVAGAGIAGTVATYVGALAGLGVALSDVTKWTKGAAEETLIYGKLLGGATGGFQNFFNEIFAGGGKKAQKKGNLDWQNSAGDSQHNALKRLVSGVGGKVGIERFDEAFAGDKKETRAAFDAYNLAIRESAEKSSVGQASLDDEVKARGEFVKTLLKLKGATEKSLYAQEWHDNRLAYMSKALDEMGGALRHSREALKKSGLFTYASISGKNAEAAVNMGKLSIGQGPKADEMNLDRSFGIGAAEAANLKIQQHALTARSLTELDPEEKEKLKKAAADTGQKFKESVTQSMIFFENAITSMNDKILEAEKIRATLIVDAGKEAANKIMEFNLNKKDLLTDPQLDKMFNPVLKEMLELKKVKADLNIISNRGGSGGRGSFLETNKLAEKESLTKSIRQAIGGFSESDKIKASSSYRGFDFKEFMNAVFGTANMTAAGKSLDEDKLGRKDGSRYWNDTAPKIAKLDTHIADLNQDIKDTRKKVTDFSKKFNIDEAKGIPASITAMAANLRKAAEGAKTTASVLSKITNVADMTIEAAGRAKTLIEKIGPELGNLTEKYNTMRGELDALQNP